MVAALLTILLLLSCSSSDQESKDQTILFPDNRSASLSLYVDDPSSYFYGQRIGSVVLIQRRTWLVNNQGWWIPATATTSLWITNESAFDVSMLVVISGPNWSWRGYVDIAPGSRVQAPDVTTSFYALDAITVSTSSVTAYPLPTGNG